MIKDNISKIQSQNKLRIQKYWQLHSKQIQKQKYQHNNDNINHLINVNMLGDCQWGISTIKADKQNNNTINIQRQYGIGQSVISAIVCEQQISNQIFSEYKIQSRYNQNQGIINKQPTLRYACSIQNHLIQPQNITKLQQNNKKKIIQQSPTPYFKTVNSIIIPDVYQNNNQHNKIQANNNTYNHMSNKNSSKISNNIQSNNQIPKQYKNNQYQSMVDRNIDTNNKDTISKLHFKRVQLHNTDRYEKYDKLNINMNKYNNKQQNQRKLNSNNKIFLNNKEIKVSQNKPKNMLTYRSTIHKKQKQQNINALKITKLNHKQRQNTILQQDNPKLVQINKLIQKNKQYHCYSEPKPSISNSMNKSNRKMGLKLSNFTHNNNSNNNAEFNSKSVSFDKLIDKYDGILDQHQRISKPHLRQARRINKYNQLISTNKNNQISQQEQGLCRRCPLIFKFDKPYINLSQNQPSKQINNNNKVSKSTDQLHSKMVRQTKSSTVQHSRTNFISTQLRHTTNPNSVFQNKPNYISSFPVQTNNQYTISLKAYGRTFSYHPNTEPHKIKQQPVFQIQNYRYRSIDTNNLHGIY